MQLLTVARSICKGILFLKKQLMKIHILAFGISRDIIGGPSLQLEVAEECTVTQLLDQLYTDFPKLKALRSLAVAVNTEYAQADRRISPQDEVVLIPPVAGG